MAEAARREAVVHPAVVAELVVAKAAQVALEEPEAAEVKVDPLVEAALAPAEGGSVREDMPQRTMPPSILHRH